MLALIGSCHFILPYRLRITERIHYSPPISAPELIEPKNSLGVLCSSPNCSLNINNIAARNDNILPNNSLEHPFHPQKVDSKPVFTSITLPRQTTVGFPVFELESILFSFLSRARISFCNSVSRLLLVRGVACASACSSSWAKAIGS